MKSSKRRIFTALALIALAIMLCFALLACDNKTNTPGQNGGQNGDENTQVSVSTIDDLGEILAALGDSYSISEKVLASAQRKFGSALAVLKSENADGTGELLVGTDEDGTLKVSAVSLALSADDFSARVFKSGTFTKTGDTISYYQGDKKQEEDISGAFTKTAENGDLTVIDATKADRKISAVFDNVTLEESGLNTQITDTDKVIFALVVGNAISADKEVFLPSLICNYNSMTDKTEVEAVYYLGGNITVCTVSFDGDLTADGFDKDEAQNQIYKETATVATAEKDCTEYDGYSTIYCKTFAPLPVEKVPSAQDLEETITFNSWNEVFNVFGKENSDLVKNKLSEILTEKLFNEENIKTLFGNDMTLKDLTKKENETISKIQILKWAFTLINDDISSVQMLGIRNGVINDTDKRLQNATFVLNESLCYNDVSAKTNVQKEIVGEYIISYKNAEGNYTVIDLTNIAINLQSSEMFWTQRFGYKPADEEGKKIFNLLMPYAVSEKTLYSHVSVNYKDGLNNKIKVEISIYNEKSNSYETWNFNVYRGDYVDDDISYSLLETLVKNGNVECLSIANKQMISGNIIFNVGNGNQNVIEISPYSQQSVSEKQ